MIILSGGVKGGSGKTTIATNLATWLAHNNKKFVLLDTDKQRSSSKWASRRDELRASETPVKPPRVFCPEKLGDGVGKFIKDLETDYGIVLIDAGGRDTPELRSAMIVSDLLIIPMAPSQLDIETIEDLSPLLEQARGFNPNLVAKIVIVKAEVGRASDELREAREALEGFPGFELSRNYISYYKIYRTAATEGLGVIETKNSRAKAEVQLLAQEIFHGI